MKKILTVVGTRPNIIKITKFNDVANQFENISHKLIHTGQHYSANMNDVFFEELSLPLPDFSLDVDKSSVIKQMAGILQGLEETVLSFQPDIMVVVGDVNSTLAASIVANKMGIKLVHVESGLRSNDNTMPEEHNRILTDSISDVYFVTEKSGLENLEKEGKDMSKVFFVGNTMIDTLVKYDKEIKASNILSQLGQKPKEYILMTIHRPGNVDNKEGLEKLVTIIKEVTKSSSIVFPIHPRTLKRLEEFGLKEHFDNNPKLILTDPLGYLDFQNLVYNSKLVLTDSGGIQEETTFRQIPCITLRPNTERPVTISVGSNVLMKFEPDLVMAKIAEIESGNYKTFTIPELWDGNATERIFGVLNTL